MSSNDKTPTGNLFDYCDDVGLARIQRLNDEYKIQFYPKKGIEKEPTKNTIFIQYEPISQELNQPQSFTHESEMTIPNFKPHSPSGFYWYLELDPKKLIAQWVHHYLIQKILGENDYFRKFLTLQNIITETVTCNNCQTEVRFFLPLSYNKGRFPQMRSSVFNTRDEMIELTKKFILKTPLPHPQTPSEKENLIYSSILFYKQNDCYMQHCPSCNEIVSTSGYDYEKNAKKITKLFYNVEWTFNLTTIRLLPSGLTPPVNTKKLLTEINFPPNATPYTAFVFPYSSLNKIQIPIKSLDHQKIDLDEQEKVVTTVIEQQNSIKTRFAEPTVKTSILRMIEKDESRTLEKKSTLFVGIDSNQQFYHKRFIRTQSDFTDKVISTISGFANTMGGTLIIGVNEKNNNEIIGIETDIEFADNIKDLDDWKRQFIDLLNGISPVEYRDIILKRYKYHEIEDGKTILEIKCPSHDKDIDIVYYKGGPKAYKSYKEEKTYKRHGPSTLPMSSPELVAHVKKKPENKN